MCRDSILPVPVIPTPVGLSKATSWDDQNRCYSERRPVAYLPYDSLRKSEAESKRMAESAPGTGYGESSWSPVSETDFDPESYPGQTVEIKYEWSTPRYYDYDRDYDRPRRDFAEPPPGR